MKRGSSATLAAGILLPWCVLAFGQDQHLSFEVASVRRPTCAAATKCTGLCSAELEVFRGVLGPSVEIARTEHIISGSRRCTYRVKRVGAAG
jgi:predicted ArsR family transcriptional regulator